MPELVTAEMLRYFAEDKAELNSLARLFYSHHGYNAPEGYDFQASTHPQERLMFSLACIASWFSREYGL